MMESLEHTETPRKAVEPVKTVRIVGFKIADYSPSPTSVLNSREGSNSSYESPRSQLAEALRVEAFHPLPRLKLRSTPRPQVPGLRKCVSHADLQRKDNLSIPGDRSEPVTPGSRASTSSTPMKIPAGMTRVHTCPIDLTAINGGTYAATVNAAGTGTLPSASHGTSWTHSRRDSEEESLVRDLFQAAAGAEPAESAAQIDVQLSQLGLDDAPVDESGIFSIEAIKPRQRQQPPQLQLRLPAAAVHRRVRSDGVPRRALQ